MIRLHSPWLSLREVWRNRTIWSGRGRWFSSIATARAGSATDETPLWDAPEAERWSEVLSGPLEAHLQLTNRCDAGCQGCYTGATPTGAAGEWGLEEWKRAIDALAARGVFHLALGGGESALLAVARRRGAARARAGPGAQPDHQSGLYGDEELDAAVRLGAAVRPDQRVASTASARTTRAVRGFDGFARADRAVVALRQALQARRHQLRGHARQLRWARPRVRLRQIAAAARGRAPALQAVGARRQDLRGAALHRRAASGAVADGAQAVAQASPARAARLLVHADGDAPPRRAQG